MDAYSLYGRQGHGNTVHGARPFFTLLLMVLFSLAQSNITYASGLSELYRSQALLLLHQNSYQDALPLLNKAVKADSEDLQALYLRGVTHLYLNNGRQALTDLQQVEKAGFRNKGLARQLSTAQLIYARQQYQRGLYRQAIDTLSKISSTEDYNARAAYWRAMSHAKLGEDKQAKQLVENSLQQYPNSEVQPKLQALLEQLETPSTQKRWRADLSIGMAQDSNVGLFPASQPLPENITDQSDNRFQMEFGIRRSRLQLLGSDNVTFGYRIFQAAYADINGYNLQSHTLSLDQRWEHGHGDWGTNYQIVIADLDSNGKQQSATVSGYHTYAHSDSRIALSKLSINNTSYSFSGYKGYGGNSIDGLYRQVFFGDTKSEQYFLGLHLNQVLAIDEINNSSGLGLDAGLEYPVSTVRLGVAYGYEARSYESRSDKISEGRIYGRYPISKTSRIELGMKDTNDTSSIGANSYQRRLIYIMGRWSL